MKEWTGSDEEKLKRLKRMYDGNRNLAAGSGLAGGALGALIGGTIAEKADKKIMEIAKREGILKNWEALLAESKKQAQAEREAESELRARVMAKDRKFFAAMLLLIPIGILALFVQQLLGGDTGCYSAVVLSVVLFIVAWRWR